MSSQIEGLAIKASEVSDLRRIFAADNGKLFAILDACDEPRVLNKVDQLGSDRAVSLYRGAAARDYRGIAPYLVMVDAELFDWIVDNLTGTPWGIFCVAESSLEILRRHFRQFLIVDGPDEEELYFRFYDPRVLAVYLQSCDHGELIDFFGPVKRFEMANQCDDSFLRMELG